MKALFRKELREHVWVLLACGAFYAFSLFALAVNPSYNGENASALHGLRMFLLGVYPFLVIVVTSRLVAREYTGRTQLFLETLPVSRGTILTAKLLLGLALSIAAVAFASWIFAKLARRHEPFDRHWLGLLALRTFVYAGCVYAFFFAGGLLGRYRVAILLILLVGLAILGDTSTFKLEEFGPLRLMGDDFAYERVRLPTRGLWVSLGLTAGFFALAYVLALVREGTVSALLAQRMSQREKVAIACVLLGMAFLKYFYDEARGPRPYALNNATRAESPHVAVMVGLGQSVNAERAQKLASRIVAGLGELSAELALPTLPEVFVLPSRDLDPDTYDRGTLQNARGVVVQANFTAPGFDDDAFVSWLAGGVVDTATRGRATEERRRWLLDGFSTDWSLRHASEETLRLHRLRAAYGFPTGPTEEMLRDWLTTRERHGDCLSSALAWTGIQVLREKLEPAALRRFLHEALARTPSSGLRALALHESPRAELLRTTGLRLEDVLAAWRARLAEDARELDGTLRTIPRLTASIDLARVSATGREVRYQVGLEPAPARPLRVAFLTRKLDPFDRELEWKDLTIDERAYPDLRTGVLPRTFSRGERLAWMVNAQVDALNCRVSSGLRRVEVP